MQKVLVAIIVLIAAIVVGRRLYRTFRGGSDACGCSGCSQCEVQSTCHLEQNQHTDER
ncbi:MAG: FeoB-associated Cys-rich membrane protein [Desulfovermiculus sp.]|nr:FeoB-associated Cys-rich membrane protein [Desulfovermiculus sp.]